MVAFWIQAQEKFVYQCCAREQSNMPLNIKLIGREAFGRRPSFLSS